MYSYDPGRENPQQHEMPGPKRRALQRHNTENSKQIFARKGIGQPQSQSHIHVSVRDLYLPTIDLPILLQKNIWTNPGNIKIAHRHRNVEIVTEATQLPEKEYINGIFVALRFPQHCCMLLTSEYFRVDWHGLLWRAQQSHRSA